MILSEKLLAPDSSPVPPLLLRRAAEEAAVARALALLNGATSSGIDSVALDSPTHVLVLADPAGEPDDPPAAVALVSAAGPASAVLEEFAVWRALPEEVVAVRLLAGVADWLRAGGCRRLLAGPGDANHRRRDLLVTAGFQDAHPEGPLELTL